MYLNDPSQWPVALTFDDVSLVPQYSEILPSQVDISTRLGNLELKAPILSAAMDTVTTRTMAQALGQLGGLGVVHKNNSIDEQVLQVGGLKCAAAVGPGADLLERASALVAAGVVALVVDTAHGHSKGVIDAMKLLRKTWPNLTLIGGNIVTAAAAEVLIDAGANAVKVGVGPGSICTTRIVTGVGVPQISAVIDVARVTQKRGVTLISDGGIQRSGDIVKALAAGANVVMLGSLLAGTDESPGEQIVVNGRIYKSYRGMGSLGAMAIGSKDRYAQGDVKDKRKLVAEGVEGYIPYRGCLNEVVSKLMGGLRSGMGYMGAMTIADLQRNAQFIRVTPSGLRESYPHDVVVDL